MVKQPIFTYLLTIFLISSFMCTSGEKPYEWVQKIVLFHGITYAARQGAETLNVHHNTVTATYNAWHRSATAVTPVNNPDIARALYRDVEEVFETEKQSVYNGQ